MPLLWVGLGILLLVVLVLVVRLDAFLALLLTAAAVGTMAGLGPLGTLDAIFKGVGTTLGNVVLVLVFGAMLGKLLDESGAAAAIVARLTRWFGPRRVPLALAAAGLVVGLPMLYNAGFLVLIPLVYAASLAARVPLVALGVATASALSVTHGFLPPHPAPTVLAAAYGAPLGPTLAYGLVAAVPACLVGGVLFGRFLQASPRASALAGVGPPPGLYTPRSEGAAAGPGFGVSLLVALAPVVCVLAGTLVDAWAGTAALDPTGANAAEFAARLAARVPDPLQRALVVAAKVLANANVALLAGVLLALWLLGVRRGRPMEALMRSLSEAAGAVAGLALVIAAGGALAGVLRAGGVADDVARRAALLGWDPLVLAFTVAAALRFAVGSATVAALTAAGLLAPVAHAGGARPELLVVATGAGSLMFSHLNDTGFWMFKQYFGLTVRQTLATWSVMEALVAVVGLLAVLGLDLVLR